MIDKLICLVLTLPISTATVERAFSVMKLVKTPLRNKMEDDFLTDCMVIYIEREIADIIDLDSIIDEFDYVKPRKTKFKYCVFVFNFFFKGIKNSFSPP